MGEGEREGWLLFVSVHVSCGGKREVIYVRGGDYLRFLFGFVEFVMVCGT